MPADPVDSIKEQILTLLFGDNADVRTEILLPLLDEAIGIRQVRREVDPLAPQAVMPAVIGFDGDEVEVEGEKDNRGRTYQFDIMIRWLTQAAGAQYVRERKVVVPRIQELIETAIYPESSPLASLVIQIDGGEERPFQVVGQPTRGADVLYTVRYRRVLGDPRTTY
jgi:hypothetical protein